ncbi:MAG: hypothetical protein HOY79_01950 [Streptomyces sp.]|nr:hypothetical protein [Streptomyces sp.]
MTEQIEDAFWAAARAEDAAARGRQADPSACGTCRGNVAAGGQVEHDGCAQRATLIPAPDAPDYELITGLAEEELAALPPRFHVPAYMESSSPQMWVCAVCWGDGWVTQWPCKTAVKYGLRVFTPEHEAETAAKRQAAELAAYQALELGDPDNRVSASCENPEHPTWLRAKDDTRGCPWCQITDLEEQRERRRLRLVALQNDALNMRGSLSPNGEDRKVPFPLGETLTPAVDWLIARVAELEAVLADAKRPSYSERHVWTVWREDQPIHAHYATEDDARQGSIDCWEEDEPACPDYSWKPDGPRLELVVGGEAGGVYISRADVFGAPGPALPWAHAMDDDDLHGFLGDLVSAAMDRWRSEPDVPDREILANVEQVCANWRTPGQGLRGDEPATVPNVRDCTTCEHHLPATPAEEQCNPDGCGCTGYPEACDIHAAPTGASFPISNCRSWEARQ